MADYKPSAVAVAAVPSDLLPARLRLKFAGTAQHYQPGETDGFHLGPNVESRGSGVLVVLIWLFTQLPKTAREYPTTLGHSEWMGIPQAREAL